MQQTINIKCYCRPSNRFSWIKLQFIRIISLCVVKKRVGKGGHAVHVCLCLEILRWLLCKEGGGVYVSVGVEGIFYLYRKTFRVCDSWVVCCLVSKLS